MTTKPTNMDEVTGSLASGYKQTLIALHTLLMRLDKLASDGKLPKDSKLDAAMLGAMTAVSLGSCHFPQVKKQLRKEGIGNGDPTET